MSVAERSVGKGISITGDPALKGRDDLPEHDQQQETDSSNGPLLQHAQRLGFFQRVTAKAAAEQVSLEFARMNAERTAQRRVSRRVRSKLQ